MYVISSSVVVAELEFLVVVSILRLLQPWIVAAVGSQVIAETTSNLTRPHHHSVVASLVGLVGTRLHRRYQVEMNRASHHRCRAHRHRDPTHRPLRHYLSQVHTRPRLR